MMGSPERMLSVGNPLLTVPAEYVTRQDFFTGRQYPEGEGFTKPSGALAPLYSALARFVPGASNEMGQVDPRFVNATRGLIPPLDRLMRLAPQLLAAESGEGTGSRQLESVLRFAGVPISTLPPELQESTQRSAYYKQLREMERRAKMMQVAAAS